MGDQPIANRRGRESPAERDSHQNSAASNARQSSFNGRQTQPDPAPQQRHQTFPIPTRSRGNATPPNSYNANPSNNSQAIWDMEHPSLQYSNQLSHRKDFLKKREYKRGMILNAPVHEEEGRLKNQSDASACRSISAHGMVFTKSRYMIVVAMHETHYVCIPLYTHEGTGLAGKEHYKHEYCSVRDGRIAKRDFKPLSNYEPLVTNGEGPKIHPVSTAWLTRPIARSYNLMISFCGHLTTESTEFLCELVDQVGRKAMGIKTE